MEICGHDLPGLPLHGVWMVKICGMLFQLCTAWRMEVCNRRAALKQGGKHDMMISVREKVCNCEKKGAVAKVKEGADG